MSIDLPCFDIECKELFILTTNDISYKQISDYQRNGYDVLMYKNIILIKR